MVRQWGRGMRLKSHETPRRQGRNIKSRAASARLRQLKKRTKTLLKRLHNVPPVS